MLSCAYAQAQMLPPRQSSSLALSYHGDIRFPGMKIGLEVPLRQTSLVKTRKSVHSKTIRRSQFLTASAGWYHHPGFHDNLYLTAGIAWRISRPGGWFAGFRPALGYSRTLLGGITYTVSEQGTINRIGAAGNSYLIGSLGMRIGYDFSQRHNRAIALFTQLSCLGLFPYNNTFLLRPIMDLGLRITPSRFLSTTPKQFTK